MKLSLILGMLCVTGAAVASPVMGTFVAAHDLPPRQGVLYHMDLKGGEDTQVDVSGTNAGGDLDCELYDGGNIIAQDTDHHQDSCHMKVAIKKTGKYSLLVINHGTVTDHATMTVQ